MKKIVLLIVILIFLTGCSSLAIFNLSDFTIPDDELFIMTIDNLKTPEEICRYMADNFEYEEHPDITLSPYQLYLIKKGDCNDYMTFSIFIADYHEYETYYVLITFANERYKHSITVYKENKYSFSDYEMYFLPKYDTFLEIVEYDCFLRREKWTEYIVYDYDNGLIEKGSNN